MFSSSRPGDGLFEFLSCGGQPGSFHGFDPVNPSEFGRLQRGSLLAQKLSLLPKRSWSLGKALFGNDGKKGKGKGKSKGKSNSGFPAGTTERKPKATAGFLGNDRKFCNSG
jgi:hypothetical protein